MVIGRQGGGQDGEREAGRGFNGRPQTPPHPPVAMSRVASHIGTVHPSGVFAVSPPSSSLPSRMPSGGPYSGSYGGRRPPSMSADLLSLFLLACVAWNLLER